MTKTMHLTYHGDASLRYDNLPIRKGDTITVPWVDGMAMCDRYDFRAGEQYQPEDSEPEQPETVAPDMDGEDDGR